MNFYQFIIPRLNGKDIEKNFDYYLRLVKKRIAGFIVFGGELETVRQGIRELQKASLKPLIIASDLEQGLGQQLEDGTLFPPAMAIASAFTPPLPPPAKGGIRRGDVGARLALPLLRKTFKAIALEAKYAGINTIFAPVLDINTNPKNPIIGTRAFGEDNETVSFFGCEMIKALQAKGIAACGKHFPGHGDTEIDSHINLPAIKKDIKSLERTELVPFNNAIKQGVKMIMLGHLNVPALDSSGIPVSLSEEAVRYLRDKMRFRGVIITDALNMHALYPPFNSPLGKGGIKRGVEEKASLMALRAGVDLLLHPTDPERIVSYLEKTDSRCRMQDARNIRSWKNRTSEIQKKNQLISIPQFEKHRELSEKLTKKALKVVGQIKPIKNPFLIILSDDDNVVEGAKVRGNVFAKRLKEKFPDLKLKIVNKSSGIQKLTFRGNAFVIVAIFSRIKAWKGGPSPWLLKFIKELEDKAEIFISFGSPYLLPSRCTGTKIYAYWDSESAQKAVAELI